MTTPQYSTKELLARLVAFDTTSHKTNLPLIRFVEDYLAGYQIPTDLVLNDEGTKANLFATIGPTNTSGICLSGHTDVVPVVGQNWDTDPFTVVEKNNKLFGRGTTDMKGFLACVLAAVPDFKSRPLKTPIHIAFSYDEEIGCVGVRPMLGAFGKSLTRPALTFVGEPTNMGVVNAHKGPIRWRVDITGRAAHSSMAPLGVNAIYYAGRIINELGNIERELIASPRDERFDPPYATLQITEIEGGTASNIVPVSCTFGFEIRALPGLKVDYITGRLEAFIENECLVDMRKTAPEADIKLTITNSVPPFSADAGTKAVELASHLTGSNRLSAVSYTTEAGLFQDADSPSVVIGPGDIAQAHTANEWLSIEQLVRCEAFMVRLADWATNNTLNT
ncbi:MAG: acetylornithine deacetylase [Hyphomicrobiaceae bacterium]